MRFLYFLLCFLAPFALEAQTITRAEYFLDSDPGTGKGTSISITEAKTINVNFNIPLTAVSKGFHKLFVRVKDSTNAWSITHSVPFYNDQFLPATNITKVEYFLDSDPGEGNATSISFTPGKQVAVNYVVPLGAISNGFHILYVRVRDGNGNWSITQNTSFYNDYFKPTSNLSRIEYFVDTDPGEGNGSPINFTPGKTAIVNYTIPLTTSSVGIHILFVRVQDANGNWSITQHVPFYTERFIPVSNLNRMEYFLDTDPGEGNANLIPITPDKKAAILYNIPLSSVTNGFHILYVRVRDENGSWSITQNVPFFNDFYKPTSNLTALEYFLDTDPGEGNANAISVTPGKTLAIKYTIPLLTASNGFHILYVRTKDENGHWSIAQNVPFFKDNFSPTSKLNRIEYFLDMDPGEGNGVSIPFAKGSSAAVQYNIPLDTITKGFHILFVRTQDANGNWSITQNTPFYRDDVEALPNLLAAEYFIDRDPGTGNGKAITLPIATDIDKNFFISLAGISSGPHTLYIRVKDAMGRWSITHNKSIQGGCGSMAHFGFTENPASTIVTFTDTSAGKNMKWFWDFGDGQVSTLQNPSCTYSKGGAYTVCLTVRDSVTGCQDRICKVVKAGNTVSCKTLFSYSTQGISTKVAFDGKSFNSDSSNYYWSFGDGRYSTLANPIHTYRDAGSYNVCLHTKDTVTGCKSQFCETILAGKTLCNAKFTAMPEAQSTTVNFADQSAGDTLKWYWDFGDGYMSNIQNPAYTYKQGGDYKVCLTVSQPGCQDSYCEVVHVGTGNCKTTFSYFNDPVKKQVEFKDQSFGNPTEWFWEFGDGTHARTQNPTHTFTQEGIFPVCLTTKNGIGCINHFCDNISIGALGEDCQAVFETFEENGVATFKNISIGDADTYFWDFGDGNYSTTSNPEHTYNKSGYYTVSLTIYNQSSGCFNTGYASVVIGSTAPAEDCQSRFSYMADTSTYVVTFKDESVGSPAKWKWNFSDGDSSEVQNPTHKFSGPGLHQACLTITSTNGTKSVQCNVVGIAQTGIGASFIFERNGVFYLKNTATYPVSFYGSAYGKPSKWKWAFGDDTYDSLRINVTHNYSEMGTYNACLTISDPIAKLSYNYCKLVKVGSVSGTTEFIKSALNINVFPNPVKDRANVTFTLAKKAHIELSLFDLQGKMIKTFVHGDRQGEVLESIDLTDKPLTDGLYFVHLYMEGRSYYKPVILKK